jgi:cysteine-rich repeat protein
MTGKTARVAVLAATFVAVSLGLWQIAAGCASAEGDDSCPTAAPRCGDGCLDPGEECDDGNVRVGDGCSNSCRREALPDGGDTPPTDDGTTPPTDDGTTPRDEGTTPRDDGGGSCPESPCRLKPYCGCEAGQKCTVDFTLLPDTLEKVCGEAGSGTSDDLCTADTECMAETICGGLYSGAGVEQAMCFDICTGASDCSGAGSVCVPLVSDEDYPGICSHSCDLVTNRGCPSGTACKPLEIRATGQSLTDCGADVGYGGPGSSCSDDTGCEAGTFCADTDGDTTGNECIQLCHYPSGSCEIGTCNAFDPPISYDGDEYGYCYAV